MTTMLVHTHIQTDLTAFKLNTDFSKLKTFCNTNVDRYHNIDNRCNGKLAMLQNGLPNPEVKDYKMKKNWRPVWKNIKLSVSDFSMNCFTSFHIDSVVKIYFNYSMSSNADLLISSLQW